jgi:hypothetical protein
MPSPITPHEHGDLNPEVQRPADRHDGEGWLYRQELVDCGKGATGRCRKCANRPGHGPYWYAYRWQDGKMHKRYVGRRLPESAWTAQPGSERPSP